MGDAIIVSSSVVSPTECLHYAVNLPTSVLITGCESLPILEQALAAVRTFRPMSQEVSALLAETAEVATQGQLEL